jgi:hypothetical protein
MKAGEVELAATRAAHWAKTLSGLRDPEVQVGWIRSQLQALGAARAADVLTVVLARAEQREERYAVLLLRVSLALATEEALSLRRAIAGLADMHGQLALARFLGADKPQLEEQAEGAEDESESPNPKAPDFGRGRPLSLGERKSLARGRDRNLLARVLRDPHPDVIRILLRNPALIEDDIVRLCALRPVSAEVLSEVFRTPRWIVRYRVKHALARNPYTPEDLAVQLVPHLTPGDRRELGFASHAGERLRAACRAPESDSPLH